MAEHRTTTRLRLAQERARKQRERNNVDGDVIGQAAEEAVVLRKTYAPPTREIHEASIAAFIKFVKDPDHGLSASEAGRCVWEEWSEGRTVEELTDYGTAKQPTVQLLHPYLMWKIGGAVGVVSRGEAMTVESAEGQVDRICGAFRQRMNDKFDHKVLESCSEYLRSVIVPKLELPDVKRDRRVPDVDVLCNVMKEFWSIRMPTSANVTRVYVSLILCLLIASGSRIGAIIRSNAKGYQIPKYDRRGLCWDKVEIWLYRNKVSNTVEIVVEFELIYTKTASGKGIKYKMYNDEIPAFDGPSWLVVVGLADGVFVGNPTFDQIYSLEVLRDRDSMKLEVKPEWKPLPVIRSYPATVSRAFDSSEGMQSQLTTICNRGIVLAYNAWITTIHQAQMLAGYPTHFSTHDVRVLAIKSSLRDKDTRLTDLQFGIGHNTLGNTWTKYLGKENMVQFQSLIMGDFSAKTVLSEISKMTRERRQDLPTYLTMEEREALQEDAELVALKKEQLEMKHAIKLQYGALTKAPEDQKLAYRDIYNDYQAREALLYKQVLHDKIQASAAEAYTAAFGSESDINLDNQIDLLQSGELADHDITLATAARELDYSNPAQIVALITGNSDPDEALQFLRETFGGISDQEVSEQGVSRGSHDLGPTSSQIKMPPPPLPNRYAESSTKHLVIDPTLLGPEGDAPAPLDYDDGKDGSDIPEFPSMPGPSLHTAAISDTSITPAQSSRRGKRRIGRLSVPASDEDLEVSSRSRSTSVTSTISTTSVPAQSVATADTDGQIAETAQALAFIGRNVMSTNVNRIDFFQKVLDLPALITEAINWIAGVFYVLKDGAQHCPVCDTSRADWRSTLEVKYTQPGQITSLWKKHIFKCMGYQAFRANVDNVVDSFKQDQLCPLCPYREPTPDDAEVTDDDEARSDQSSIRTPVYWAIHVSNEHAHKNPKECACGSTISGSADLIMMHFAVKHDIFASFRNKPQPLSPSHFDARYSCQDGCFHVDPRTYEADREQQYSALQDLLPPNASWGVRTDIAPGSEQRKTWDQAIARLDSICPPLATTVPDKRWIANHLDSLAEFYEKEGFCMFCFYQSDESYTTRLWPWNSSTNARWHISNHLFQMYADTHAHLILDEENPLAREPPTTPSLPIHKCLDPTCGFSQVLLHPWELTNHLVIHHRALRIDPKAPNQHLSFSDKEYRDLCIKLAKSKKSPSDRMAKYGLNWQDWNPKATSKPKVISKKRFKREEPGRQRKNAGPRKKKDEVTDGDDESGEVQDEE